MWDLIVSVPDHCLSFYLEYQFFHVMLRVVLFENASFHFLFACFI